MSASEDMLDGEQLKEIIENQLSQGDPIRVKETLIRLMMTGTERPEAIDLMACALGLELEAMARTGKAFNTDRYCTKLEQLPDAPWLSDLSAP